VSRICLFILLGLSVALASRTSVAQSAPDAGAIEAIVRDYLLRNPEVIYEALQELQRRRELAESERQRQVLATRGEALFNSVEDPVVGNPTGDVTVVEFFDYRCGYCRNMMPGIRNALQEDPNIRLVLKEFPILGPDSVTAAKAALAAKNQGRYADMHWALLQAEDLSAAGLTELAGRLGLDTGRLAADMESAETRAVIERNLQLAQDLGINGTPTFIIGEHIVPGAVPIDDLVALVAEVREAN
jgi:protein-disulfide isomerase